MGLATPARPTAIQRVQRTALYTKECISAGEVDGKVRRGSSRGGGLCGCIARVRVATPQAARGWARPPCRHFKTNLASAWVCFEAAAFQTPTLVRNAGELKGFKTDYVTLKAVYDSVKLVSLEDHPAVAARVLLGHPSPHQDGVGWSGPERSSYPVDPPPQSQRHDAGTLASAARKTYSREGLERLRQSAWQATVAPPTAQRPCGVCNKQLSKYLCPRCNLPYCSVGCYRNHGTGCTEAFAKDNLDQHLHGESREVCAKSSIN